MPRPLLPQVARSLRPDRTRTHCQTDHVFDKRGVGSRVMPKGSKVVFLTSWALVFLSVDRRPTATVREIASVIGITDRQVHRVLADLEAEGYITRTRVGRAAETGPQVLKRSRTNPPP